MDLENLTKHQIILLTLLVSFVTSMATGIVTVSLMNQAPPVVTRTINQIVEHTVQAVVPSNTTQQNQATVATQKTIVIKDDDLVAQTIATLQKSVIRVTARGSNELLARGIVVGKNTALTDRDSLVNSGAKEFDAILSNGARVSLILRSSKATSTLIQIVTLVSASTSIPSVQIADTSKLTLGQSVLRISGKGSDSVGQGVIASLDPSTNEVESSVGSSIAGSVLATRFGEVVGISTSVSLMQSSEMYSVVTKSALEPQTNETKPLSKP